MSPPLIGLSGILVLFVLLILRVPVWIALLLVGFVGNAVLLGWQGAFALAGTAPLRRRLQLLAVGPAAIHRDG
jgi:hypothetical protein